MSQFDTAAGCLQKQHHRIPHLILEYYNIADHSHFNEENLKPLRWKYEPVLKNTWIIYIQVV